MVNNPFVNSAKKTEGGSNDLLNSLMENNKTVNLFSGGANIIGSFSQSNPIQNPILGGIGGGQSTGGSLFGLPSNSGTVNPLFNMGGNGGATSTGLFDKLGVGQGSGLQSGLFGNK